MLKRRFALPVSLLTAFLLLSACEQTIINQPPSGNQPPGNGDSNGDSEGKDSNTEISVSLNADSYSGSIPLSVTLRANVSGADGNLEYLWALPGAERDIRAGETYTTLIGEAGSYTYNVTVSDGQGQATNEVTVEVTEPTLEPGNDAPVVRLSVNPTEGIAPQVVTFTARGSDPNGDTLEYIWDFGDDTVISGGATITHTYEEAGYYRAQVIATDGRGGIDRDQVDVEVVPPPATLNLNVTPDNANWNFYNSFWYDDYYGIDEYGTGNETFQLPADYYYIIVEADGYYTEYGEVFVGSGETETVSVVLTPISEDPPVEDPPVEDPPVEDPEVVALHTG